jgi:hypothetical protein
MDNHTWPVPSLSTVHEQGHQPTRQLINKAFKQLCTNAASLNSWTAGRGHGIIGAIIDDAAYVTLTQVNWQEPAAPPAPVLDATDTQFVIQAAYHANRAAEAQYKLYLTGLNELRNQLLAAIPNKDYISHLEDDITGFGRVAPRAIIDHLRTTYGAFDEIEQNDAEEKMALPWTTGPFEAIIAQINKGARLFDQAGNPKSEADKVKLLYNISANSGRLGSACKKWRRRPMIEKTWDNAKAHFLWDANDLENQDTAASAGFSANWCVTIKDEMELASKTLASNTEKYAHAVQAKDKFEAENIRLKGELASAKAQLNIYKQLLSLEPQGGRRNQTGRGNGAGGRGDGGRGRGNRRGLPAHILALPNYCWSCGYNDTHNSPNCPQKLSNHQDDATRTTPMHGMGHRGDP